MSLNKIYANLEQGQRLTNAEALYLYEFAPLLDLARLANQKREALHQSKTYFVRNKHIDYSNLCVLDCKFCAFARRPNQAGGFELSHEQILHKISEDFHKGISEVHIVGGFHPKHPYEFYTGLLQKIKRQFPHIHIKAFTAAEIEYFARKFKKSKEIILLDFIESGLGSLPGGGAEIFDEVVRKEICGPKGPASLWLETHALAHRLGLRSTATMLYGHIESLQHRIEHMSELRELQDKTGGFLAFIPLAFNPQDTVYEKCGYTSGYDDLKTLAIARLYFDNIRHIKAYWVMSGMDMAELAQYYGADDLHGTVIEENITRLAGGRARQEFLDEQICRIIYKAGRVPVLRDSLYNEIQPTRRGGQLNLGTLLS